MKRSSSIHIIIFIILLSAQRADLTIQVQQDNALSLSQTNINLIKPQIISREQHPRITQQSLSIPINHVTQQIPYITDYLATKSIYPNAKVPEVIKLVQTSKQFQRQFSIDNIQIENSQKHIVWKIGSLTPILNYVLSDGIQTPLIKAQTIQQTGKAILATQGPTNNPLFQDIPANPIVANQIQQKNTFNRPQKQQQGLDFQPSRHSHPISSFNTYNNLSPGSPDADRDSSSKDKTIEQLQNLLDKSHRWSVIFVFLLIALIFFIFLFIRYQRSKKTSFWSENRPKLDRYRNSVAVGQKQQDLDFVQPQNININDQFEYD